MIKKAASVFIVLLTSMILLGHAVVPHHHHHNEPFTLNSHCQEKYDSHQHESHDHHRHDHNGNEDTECCVLKHVVVIISNQIQLKNRSVIVDQYLGFDGVQAILSGSNTNKSINLSLNERQVPLIASFYSRTITSNKGFRAPPLG